MSEFMEVKTAELEGAALDWAVAIAVGEKSPQPGLGGRGCVVAHGHTLHRFVPSAEWSHGGPLIDKHVLQLKFYQHEYPDTAWRANAHNGWAEGRSPLIAACRAIVASVLGDTVQVPKELCQ